jgi:hypothetical protein
VGIRAQAHRRQPRAADRHRLQRAARGKREELKAALDALIEPAKREDGDVNYDLHQGVEDPDFFTFHENWGMVGGWTDTAE